MEPNSIILIAAITASACILAAEIYTGPTRIAEAIKKTKLHAVKRALHRVGRRGSSIADHIPNYRAKDLARLNRRALADAGYGRIDWDSENGEAIQHALIRIYDW